MLPHYKKNYKKALYVSEILLFKSRYISKHVYYVYPIYNFISEMHISCMLLFVYTLRTQQYTSKHLTAEKPKH